MATTIYSSAPLWKNWEPAAPATEVDNVSQTTSGGLQILSWGIPIVGEQASLSFDSVSPPSLSVDLGDEITLGSLTFGNLPIAGEPLSTVLLELTIRFASATGIAVSVDVPVIVTYTDTEAVVSIDGTVPLSLTQGGLTLSITGFAGDWFVGTQGSFVCPIDFETTVALKGILLSSPMEGVECSGDFTPVFQPVGCIVPAICPITDAAFLEDCSIPEAPEPITDCPNIDIPVGMSMNNDSFIEQINNGSGLQIDFESSYTVIYVEDCTQVRIELTILPCRTTTTGNPLRRCYRLHFTIYYCLPWFQAFCCPMKWCYGVWVPMDDYLCAYVDVPVISGRFDGELIWICPCTTTTTTTTEPPCTAGTDVVIMVCNANAGVDDNFDIKLNGTTIGSVDFSAGTCAGGFWRTDGGLLVEIFYPEIDDCCNTFALGASSLDIGDVVLGSNTLQMVNTQDNHHGNWGVVKVASVKYVGGEWQICCMLLDTTYSGDSGESFDFTFAYPCGATTTTTSTTTAAPTTSTTTTTGTTTTTLPPGTTLPP